MPYKKEMNPSLKMKIIEQNNKRESECLCQNASKSIDGIRREKDKKLEDARTKYSRDTDRILHTRAYSRYVDKTQVFFLVDNDHITHRVLHVQLVSKIARTIGRALKLNEDLIEAISLGHDIGHVPYGHLGEDYLSNHCLANEIGYFRHNAQSIQFLDKVENVNLTLQVLDGILSHNGEVVKKQLKPNYTKTWDIFDKEFSQIISNKKIDFMPMTLEGCVVRVSDVIAYLGRDIQDALEVKLISEESIPENLKNTIGENNADIINSLIIDIIENSFDEEYISFSQETANALQKYKEFNYKAIYLNERLRLESPKIEFMYEQIFNKLITDLDSKNTNSTIYPNFMLVKWIDKNYLAKANNAEKTRDYIAGMTDRYFDMFFKQIIIPNRITSFDNNNSKQSVLSLTPPG